MINWSTFKDNLKSYFSSYIATDSSTAAEYIALQYDLAMKQGGDIPYGNFVVNGNRDLMTTLLKSAFNTGYGVKSGTYNSLDAISKALVGYWVGATLSFAIPPPGSIGIVQNTVLNTGNATGIVTPPTNEFDTWINMFITMARLHLLSISGTTIAIVSTPAGPVPTPFPWQGYN